MATYGNLDFCEHHLKCEDDVWDIAGKAVEFEYSLHKSKVYHNMKIEM